MLMGHGIFAMLLYYEAFDGSRNESQLLLGAGLYRSGSLAGVWAGKGRGQIVAIRGAERSKTAARLFKGSRKR